MTIHADLERILRTDFDDGFVTFEPSELETYGRDWTRVHPPAPSAVVFPTTDRDVQRLMPLVQRYDAAVVPSGGRTGLAGGAIAAGGEIVLSLERMRGMDEVDDVARTVRVQAGAITQAVHAHAQERDLTWPVDFASSGSSQIGGNIATNAGGIRVVRYGATRSWTLGLEVVTVDGELLQLNGALEKNNTGVDLKQIFIGSEGTLGVITAATLKLEQLPGETRVALFAVPGLPRALELFRSVRSASGFELCAFEFLTDACLEVVEQHGLTTSPFGERHPAYVLVEVEARAGWGAVDTWLQQTFEEGLVLDGVLAESSQRSRELWKTREGISESLSRTGHVHKNDVAIPVSRLPSFVSEMQAALNQRYPDFRVFLFGHVGDGNVHINVMKPESMDVEPFEAHCREADEVLFGIVERYQGSISAEHGIGLLKKPFLRFSRSPAELELFRRMKMAFDPNRRLNPGKIFD